MSEDEEVMRWRFECTGCGALSDDHHNPCPNCGVMDTFSTSKVPKGGAARPAYERARAFISYMNEGANGGVLHGAIQAALIATANGIDARNAEKANRHARFKQEAVYRAKWVPKDISTVKSYASSLVGKTLVFTASWVITLDDGGPYVGEWALHAFRERNPEVDALPGRWFGWVPACDLQNVVLIEAGLEVDDAVNNVRIENLVRELNTIIHVAARPCADEREARQHLHSILVLARDAVA